MKLANVWIRNFRSIKDVTIDFQPRCRVLVGINESGKSNILRALSLLDPSVTALPTDRREPLPDEDYDDDACVQFRFTLDAQDREAISRLVDAWVLMPNEAPPLAVRSGGSAGVRDLLCDIREAVYEVDLTGTNQRRWFTWDTSDDFSVADGWYVPSDACPPGQTIVVNDQKPTPLKKVRLIEGGLAADIQQSFLNPDTRHDINLLRDALTAKVAAPMQPQCVYWTYSDSNLLPAQIALDAFASNPDVSRPLREMFHLAGIQEIADAINTAKSRGPNQLRNLLAKVAEITTKHLRSVWTDYKDIRIELLPNGANVDCVVREEHNVYDFARRSDGFKRFISFLLLVSAKHRSKSLVNTLYLHDEPDTGLHPSGARHLRDELIRISENNFVVYATHSIFMVDREDIGRHLMVTKKREVTKIEPVGESNISDEEVIYNALGYSVFECLKRNNLIFEGWRDKKLFVTALRKSGQDVKQIKGVLGDLGLCHARGVKDIGRIVPLLELANRDWLIVSDSDDAARERQARYDGEGPWFRYDQLLGVDEKLTAEDLVTPKALLTAYDGLVTSRGGLPALVIADLDIPAGRLSVIKGALARAGIQGDEQKACLDQFKGLVFDSLSPTAVEDRYVTILKTVAQKLTSSSSN